MIERVAYICLKGKDIILPMVSVIEVHQDKITLFRDYFDTQTFANQMA